MTAKKLRGLVGTNIGVIKGDGQPKGIKQYLWTPLGALVCIALIVIAALLIWQFDISKNSHANAGCSTELITRTNRDLQNHNVENLQTDVADAKKTKGYNQDQNCLYITMAAGTATGNKALAQPAIDQLNKLSGGKRLSISKLFDNPLTTAEASASVQADYNQQKQEDDLNKAQNADWAQYEAEHRK